MNTKRMWNFTQCLLLFTPLTEQLTDQTYNLSCIRLLRSRLYVYRCAHISICGRNLKIIKDDFLITILCSPHIEKDVLLLYVHHVFMPVARFDHDNKVVVHISHLFLSNLGGDAFFVVMYMKWTPYVALPSHLMREKLTHDGCDDKIDLRCNM